MENQNTPTPGTNSLFDLSLDEASKQSLKSAANMGGIAAIFTIVGAGLGVVSHFVQKNRPAPEEFEGFEKMSSPADSFSLVGMVISLLISFLLFYFLNKFASSTKAGLDGNDQGRVTEGLGNLSSYFKTLGIILIIILCLLFLGLLAGLAGSASSQ